MFCFCVVVVVVVVAAAAAAAVVVVVVFPVRKSTLGQNEDPRYRFMYVSKY